MLSLRLLVVRVLLLSLSATAASSSSKSLAPLSKYMQMLWHARRGHVGFETITRAAHTDATTGIDLTAHTKNCNCHTCLLQKASRNRLRVLSSSERQSLVMSSIPILPVRCRRHQRLVICAVIHRRQNSSQVYLLIEEEVRCWRCAA
jgi:GAG-pre-integrase domain